MSPAADRPAILNGTPVCAGKAWPRWPQWNESEREGLGRVLESGAWSVGGGREAMAWAAELAAFQGARHGIPLTNGTQTLEAALFACGVGEGDEVIVPAFTFVATATAALAVNATPVLVDVDPASLCIDVEAAEAAVTDRTRAIIAVHLAGVAADLDALADLCRRRDLVLIEDCAHAPGTRWRARGVGGFGSFGSFSFEAHKLITAGEGGALITDDEDLRARAWSYADCGRVGREHPYHHATYGSNLRMTEWQGAVLRAQLERYPEQLRTRQESAKLLDAELSGIAGITPQAEDPRMDIRAVYSYVLHFDAAEFAGLSRDAFEEALRAEGLEVGIPYPSLNSLELFRAAKFAPRLRTGAPRVDYGQLRLPGAEGAAATTVWLTHRMLLAEPDRVLDIVRAISRVQANAEAIRRRTRGLAGLATRVLGAAGRVRS
jgi:dTDP-4-amino-4,6-dideoxygalactose transaminase